MRIPIISFSNSRTVTKELPDFSISGFNFDGSAIKRFLISPTLCWIASKAVFKTAVEIDQRWVIELAADRQEYICQSQSLNVFFPADVSKAELHAIHMMAWKKKVKTLYYLRSEAFKRADKVSDEALRQMIFDSVSDDGGCLACEG